MAAQNMPAAEVDIDERLVRQLLGDQHPDLAHLPLTMVANGWDNVIFRLGHEMTVRLPRRQLAADRVVKVPAGIDDASSTAQDITEAGHRAALPSIRRQESLGIPLEVLDNAGLRRLEPALPVSTCRS